jgi:hypothetical protein
MTDMNWLADCVKDWPAWGDMFTDMDQSDDES